VIPPPLPLPGTSPPVAGGAAVPFTNVAIPPSSGLITKPTLTDFEIQQGVYRISWQATVSSGGQLEIWAGPASGVQTALPRTTAGSSRSNSPISNTTLYEATAVTRISLRNPSGNAALQFAVGSGSTSRVAGSVNICIEYIAPRRSVL
jgi:hypothetical protein